MTEPKKKFGSLMKFVAFVVLLAVIVPAGYMYLSGNGALESFRQVFAGSEETLIVNDEYADSVLPGEAIRVGGVMLNVEAEPEVGVMTGEQTEVEQPAEEPPLENEEIAVEKPGLFTRLIELIFGREKQVEVYE